VKRWQEYQHQAAGLLRELGFTAYVDEKLVEPNGTEHAIDVVARRTVAGVEVLWIVECKLWNRNVPKEKVLTLQSIVTNLGADRGVLISDKGSSRAHSGPQSRRTSPLPAWRISAPMLPKRSWPVGSPLSRFLFATSEGNSCPTSGPFPRLCRTTSCQPWLQI
jgi:hypothetical protein